MVGNLHRFALSPTVSEIKANLHFQGLFQQTWSHDLFKASFIILNFLIFSTTKMTKYMFKVCDNTQSVKKLVVAETFEDLLRKKVSK